MQLVLRVPRWQPAPAPTAAARRSTGDTALGVDGIELREQSHEEALLSTIGTCPDLGSVRLEMLMKLASHQWNMHAET